MFPFRDTRYNRQECMPEWGMDGQPRLSTNQHREPSAFFMFHVSCSMIADFCFRPTPPMSPSYVHIAGVYPLHAPCFNIRTS